MKIGYLMQNGAANMVARPRSGPGHHVYQVCRELGSLGHEVQILMKWEGQLWRSVDLEQYTPLPVTPLDRGLLRLVQRVVGRTQSTLHLPYFAFFEALTFAQACRQWLGDCDLLYERMGWLGYGGALAARWLEIPLVLEVNGDHWMELQYLGIAPQGVQKWLALQLMGWLAQQAAHVITTGDGWRASFLERWPIAPPLVTTVENGSELVALLRREQLRAFAEPAQEAPIKVVYAGGFEPWHGISRLLSAVAAARQQGAPVVVTLIGTGPEQPNIERQITALGLQRVVTLLGFVDLPTLAAQLAQADIGVCPYCGRVEYSGLKLLDYKAAGLAIIASGTQGQPAVIRHGATGLIVAPCDEAQLTQAIIDLSVNHEQRQAMGRRARLEAEARHHWRNTAQQVDQILRQVTLAQCQPRERLML